MNRRHIAVLIGVGIALLMAVPAHAVRLGTLTGRAEISVIADGSLAVKTVRGGAIYAVSVMGGTAPCTIIVYDSVNRAGATVANIKWEGRTSANNETYSKVFSAPLMTDNGIFVEVSGANAVGIIAFE